MSGDSIIVVAIGGLFTMWVGIIALRIMLADPNLLRFRRDVRKALAARKLVDACYVSVGPKLPGCAGGNHWPRDAVRLADGTVVAHICRRCDHSWANEHWVTSGR